MKLNRVLKKVRGEKLEIENIYNDHYETEPACYLFAYSLVEQWIMEELEK